MYLFRHLVKVEKQKELKCFTRVLSELKAIVKLQLEFEPVFGARFIKEGIFLMVPGLQPHVDLDLGGFLHSKFSTLSVK